MAGVTGDTTHNLKVYGDRDPPKAESTFFGEGSIPLQSRRQRLRWDARGAHGRGRAQDRGFVSGRDTLERVGSVSDAEHVPWRAHRNMRQQPHRVQLCRHEGGSHAQYR